MRLLLSNLAILFLSASASRATSQTPATPDTAAHDSVAPVRLPTVEIRQSIVPAAGSVGSGTPARVTILEGSAVRSTHPRTLAEALATSGGVSGYDDLGTPYKLNLMMRGFNIGPTIGFPSGATVFVDGIRENEPAAQEVNFDLLPTEYADRVEVLNGAASLLGPNSLAGAVNVLTPAGDGPRGARAETSIGSFGSVSGQLTAKGGLARTTTYYTGAGIHREAGWRDDTGALGYNTLVNIDRPSTRLASRLQLYVARSRARTAGSLPESIFASAPRTNLTAGDFDDLSLEQIALFGSVQPNTAVPSYSLYLRGARGERFNVNQAPAPNVRNLSGSQTAGANVGWRMQQTSTPVHLFLRFGGEGTITRTRVRIFERDQTSETLTTDVRSPSADAAAFALVEARLGGLTISGAARYDIVRVVFDDRPNGNETVNVFSRGNPRAGLSYAFAGTSAYASVGRSFRAPAILELACADPDATCPLPFALGDDPPLAPVQATTYETGLTSLVGPLLVSASLYRTDVRDEIFFVAADAPSLSGYFRNIPRTRRQGAELSAKVAVGQWLNGFANYTATKATFQSRMRLASPRADQTFAASAYFGNNDVESGDRLPLVPDWQISAGFAATIPGGFDVGLQTTWTGRKWLRGDEANETRPLPAYSIVGASIAWKRSEWEIAAALTNALGSHAATFGTFNENRRTGQLERFLTPLNGRSIKLTVARSIGGGGDSEF